MSGRRRSKIPGSRRRALYAIPSAKPGASLAVELALRIRNEANVTGRCICGATLKLFEVPREGPMVPVTGSPQRGKAYYGQFEHEDDCPAISPALMQAVERGEVNDPGSAILESLQGP